MAMTHPVHLAPIEIDEHRRRAPERSESRAHTLGEACGGDVPAATQCGGGQTGPVEAAEANSDDVDVRPDDAFKDRRRRLPREGIRTPLPTEVIEEPIAAGNPKLIAKQAVTTGTSPSRALPGCL